jgi:hypothetical protein
LIDKKLHLGESSKNTTASLTKKSITLCLNSHKDLSSSTTSWEIHLKRTLNVRMSAVNFTVYFELGRIPMYVERYYRMLKYWCKILKTENIVLKLVMNPCLNQVIKSLIRSLTGLVILVIFCGEMASMIYGSLS